MTRKLYNTSYSFTILRGGFYLPIPFFFLYILHRISVSYYLSPRIKERRERYKYLCTCISIVISSYLVYPNLPLQKSFISSIWISFSPKDTK
ncbi:hypothetical protein EDC94DRAFT_610715 [Helicostylum pulchrum]|nr:hypothetical protein EDC94DRAFT_610715 [Helicostylum pulchrum]